MELISIWTLHLALVLLGLVLGVNLCWLTLYKFGMISWASRPHIKLLEEQNKALMQQNASLASDRFKFIEDFLEKINSNG